VNATEPYSRRIPDAWTLPQELINRPIWCAWKLVHKAGKSKPDKVPVSPRSSSSKSWASDPAFCATFEDAAKFAREDNSLQGVGIVLHPESGLIGGDLDGCVDPATSGPNALAAEIIQAADTYTEVSPGLNGYRFIAEGTFGGFTGNNRSQGVELYESGRFLTITGLHVADTPLEVSQRDLSGLGKRFFGKQETQASPDNLPAVPDRVDITRFDLATHVHQWIVEGTEKGVRSERLLQCAKDLYRAGASAGEILSILSDPEYGISSKPLEERHGDIQSAREWLYRYTVTKAVALVDAEPRLATIDLKQHQAANLLATPPPVQQYVIQDLLPEPVAAAIVAPGGTGKSFWLMQLAVAVASGSPFMGCAVERPGGVLMLAAEDDRAELARRLHSIVSTSDNPFDQRSDKAREATGRNFYPVSRLADDNRITIKGTDGSITTNTALVETIIKTAKQVPNLRLIILDPVSRFRAGEENASEDNTRFVEALEKIRKETGVTVLVAHHSRKGADGETQDSIRGSSAFVDALRWAATLTVPAKIPHLTDCERKKLVRFTLVKSNYRVTINQVWFKRGEGGTLDMTQEPQKQSRKDADSQHYAETLSTLKDTVRELAAKRDSVTKTFIANNYGGVDGRFEAGQKKVLEFIEMAIRDGQLIDDEGQLSVNE